MSDANSGLVSGDGEVWIFPVHFFQIVGQLRYDAVLNDDLTPMIVPEVASETGTSYLEALVNSIDEARTMLASNLEIAGRALMAAGSRTVDADMVEEGATNFWGLTEGPWERYENDADREQVADQQNVYYDDINAYTTYGAEDD